MQPIRIGIIGVGNCASSLVQGIYFYSGKKREDAVGILHWDINGYTPSNIVVASAFDIDQRKVRKDVNTAIFQPPNCTARFVENLSDSGIQVSMGKIMDGVAGHMKDHDREESFVVSNAAEPEMADVIRILKETRTQILLNYLPVGSEQATRFYAQCALEARVAFINNIPVFLASDPKWAARFAERKIPLIGDDIKSQMGATIIHRNLVNLFARRGVKLDRTYQMNTGGNTDFLNMKDQSRLSSKKKSKTEAVKSVMGEVPKDRNVHIGPSDYVPWLKDNKVAFMRLEGRIFGDIPMDLELRLSVEDSPNSAGAAIDCIRLCKTGLDRKIGGVLKAPSALFCKRPPEQFTDDTAYAMTEEFIKGM
ncbi:MAG: inositol-3-phosphate synthase [Desulfobacteraceae bacterium]|nr:inositol-3-phosphate synthase [Desulfobacteraceae bacterium]